MFYNVLMITKSYHLPAAFPEYEIETDREIYLPSVSRSNCLSGRKID